MLLKITRSADEVDLDSNRDCEWERDSERKCVTME
jgi:hypothetical protein